MDQFVIPKAQCIICTQPIVPFPKSPCPKNQTNNSYEKSPLTILLQLFDIDPSLVSLDDQVMDSQLCQLCSYRNDEATSIMGQLQVLSANLHKLKAGIEQDIRESFSSPMLVMYESECSQLDPNNFVRFSICKNLNLVRLEEDADIKLGPGDWISDDVEMDILGSPDNDSAFEDPLTACTVSLLEAKVPAKEQQEDNADLGTTPSPADDDDDDFLSNSEFESSSSPIIIDATDSSKIQDLLAQHGISQDLRVEMYELPEQISKRRGRINVKGLKEVVGHHGIYLLTCSEANRMVNKLTSQTPPPLKGPELNNKPKDTRRPYASRSGTQFQCLYKQCPRKRSYKTEEDRAQHMERCSAQAMPINEGFKCRETFHCQVEDCPRVYPFYSQEDLDTHELKVHQGVTLPFECHICALRFDENYKKLQHIKLVHPSASCFTCEQCGKEFPQNFKLQRHIRTHSSTTVKSQNCLEPDNGDPNSSLSMSAEPTGGKTTRQRERLRGVLYRCLFKNCHSKKAYVREEERARHMAQCVAQDLPINQVLKFQEKIECQVLGCSREYSFYFQEDLDAHVRQAHEGIPDPFECHICGARFDLNYKKLEHVKLVHPSSINFKCEQCGKEFSHNFKLQRHILTHSTTVKSENTLEPNNGDPNNSLSISAEPTSDKKTRRRERLQGVLYRCLFKDCHSKKAYVREEERARHMAQCVAQDLPINQVLKFQEKIECQVLGCSREYSFYFQEDLDAHVRQVHEGIPDPFECNICGARFDLNYKKLEHVRLVHPSSTNFTCELCGKSFRYNFRLKNHLRTHVLKTEEESQDALTSGAGGDPSGTVTEKRTNSGRKRLKGTLYRCLYKQCPKKGAYIREEDRAKHMSKCRAEAFPINEDFKHEVRLECEVPDCPREYPFYSSEDLDAHVLKVHQGVPNPYQCHVCGARFEENHKKLEHVKLVHPCSNNFTCDQCGKSFRYVFRLNAHLRTHAVSDNDEPSNGDGQTYSNRDRNKRRQRMKGTLYRCLYKQCPKKGAYTTEEERAKHMARCRAEAFPINEEFKSKEQFHCQEPGCSRQYPFYSEEDLEMHVKKLHEGIPDPYECPFCSARFPERNKKFEHIHVHHPTAERYTCPHCNKSFGHKHHRDEHVLTHTSPLAFKCSDCPRAFTVPRQLTEHKRRVHDEGGMMPGRGIQEKKHECDICGQKFLLPSGLRSHVEIVHVKAEHVCRECGKVFSSWRYLYGHLRYTHQQSLSGEPLPKPLKRRKKRDHICNFCGKVYAHLYSLKCHQKVHHQPDNLTEICHICGKAYPLRDFLYRHMRETHQMTLQGEPVLGYETRKKKPRTTTTTGASNSQESPAQSMEMPIPDFGLIDSVNLSTT